jgi:hypothetical protein
MRITFYASPPRTIDVSTNLASKLSLRCTSHEREANEINEFKLCHYIGAYALPHRYKS